MGQSREVKKAVITAAGRGTRFLPATKIIPKEMLPIGNYPTIHYILQECKDSGIEEVCIVIREWGSMTEKYFEKDHELRDFLEAKGKDDLLERISDPGLGLKITFQKQDENLPIGHGAPLLSAKSFIDDDNFAMVFCDDLVAGQAPAVSVLKEAWAANPELGGVILSAPVPEGKSSSFSSIKFAEGQGNGVVRILEDYIEKPQTPEEAFEPECFVGRAVYTADIIKQLEVNLESGQTSAGEFSALDAMLDVGRVNPIGVVKTEGKWLTTGNPEQMWEAQKVLIGGGDKG